MKSPVLFLIFNRLDTTQKVFEEIRAAKPKRLYLASDGPRVNKTDEEKIVENVRSWVLNHIDWECDVKTRFNQKNLGCGKNVSSAITWFFKNETEGIILEDDCVPHPDFFTYCDELLNKYRDEKQIWHIAGYNPLTVSDIPESYYFAKRMHCWGWASWADRWDHYTFDLRNYKKRYLKNFSSNKKIISYWKNILAQMKKHKIDTWDYQWAFNIIANQGLCINPAKNLISNIGDVGVHYSQGNTELHRPTFPCIPLIHPQYLKYNDKQILLIDKKLILNAQSSQKQKKSVLLFGFIPLLSIKRKKNIWRISFWGIPMLKIKTNSPSEEKLS